MEGTRMGRLSLLHLQAQASLAHPCLSSPDVFSATRTRSGGSSDSGSLLEWVSLADFVLVNATVP